MSGRCYPDTAKIKHFRADADERLEGEHQYVEVRYFRDQPNDTGDETIDEICTTQLHMECMDYDSYWMSVCGLHVWFSVEMVKVEGKRNRQPVIRVTAYPSSCEPYVVNPGEGAIEMAEKRYAASHPGSRGAGGTGR